MPRITLDLLRKRAEHNNGEISTLEEVSLHQQEIERIELLDVCCKELKIVYLQNNSISKIEHVARLKELIYLNLALNNITVIENLEGCENLQKLDLTVNFVGDLRTVATLARNRELRELYLTGNPCSQYEGYRAYVLHTLPQLQKLDGVAVTRSERLRAEQDFERIRAAIEEQSAAYVLERARARAELPADESLPPDADVDEEEKRYWEEHTDYTPEARERAQRRLAAIRKRKEQIANPTQPKPPRALERDGRPLNINEGNWSFVLEGQGVFDPDLILDLACYRYLDTSQIDLDVHPTHVRVVMKGKIFQLVLPDEVKPDSERCRAERSQTTGHLRITMPKAAARPVASKKAGSSAAAAERAADKPKDNFLEIPSQPAQGLNLANIVSGAKAAPVARPREARPNDVGFVDSDDVPPLE